jgi:hypothetical protein
MANGHSVRATSRDAGRLSEIDAIGAEAVEADPLRLATLVPQQLANTSAVCWLFGSASGEGVEDLHGTRLRTVLERLVDSPARGLVYEAAGTVDPELLREGTASVREAHFRWHMPVEIVEHDPADTAGWATAMAQAVERLLSA